MGLHCVSLVLPHWSHRHLVERFGVPVSHSHNSRKSLLLSFVTAELWFTPADHSVSFRGSGKGCESSGRLSTVIRNRAKGRSKVKYVKLCRDMWANVSVLHINYICLTPKADRLNNSCINTFYIWNYRDYFQLLQLSQVLRCFFKFVILLFGVIRWIWDITPTKMENVTSHSEGDDKVIIIQIKI